MRATGNGRGVRHETAPATEDQIEHALTLAGRLLRFEEADEIAWPDDPATLAMMLSAVRQVALALARDLAAMMGVPGNGQVGIDVYLDEISADATLRVLARRLDGG